MHQGNQNEVASSVLEEGRELMPASRLVHPDTSSMLLTLPCWERKSRERGKTRKIRSILAIVSCNLCRHHVHCALWFYHDQTCLLSSKIICQFLSYRKFSNLNNIRSLNIPKFNTIQYIGFSSETVHTRIYLRSINLIG